MKHLIRNICLLIIISTSISANAVDVNGIGTKNVTVNFDSSLKGSDNLDISQATSVVGTGVCLSDITPSYGAAFAALAEEEAARTGKPVDYSSTKVMNAVGNWLLDKSPKNNIPELLTKTAEKCARSFAESACLDADRLPGTVLSNNSFPVQPGFKILDLDTTGMIFKGRGYITKIVVRCE